MSTSLVYRSARGYELLMRVLYGSHYEDRLAVVAERVPSGSSVLELCCGPGRLYTRYLRGRVSSYIGLDVNVGFIERLRRQGVDARQLDLSADAPLPPADVAIMQASLYHFLPEPRPVLERMLSTASDRVIVSEPVRNLSTSGVPLVGSLSRRTADPGTGGHEQRFSEQTLDALVATFAPRVLEAFPAPGGREKVFVLDARRPPRSDTGDGS